jgi:hypothetical protein
MLPFEIKYTIVDRQDHNSTNHTLRPEYGGSFGF